MIFRFNDECRLNTFPPVDTYPAFKEVTRVCVCVCVSPYVYHAVSILPIDEFGFIIINTSICIIRILSSHSS